MVKIVSNIFIGTSATAMADPSKNLKPVVCYYVITAMPFFASLVMGFPAAVNGSDLLYDKIYIVQTKLISHPVSKFSIRKKVSKLAFSGSKSGSPFPIHPPTPIPSILNAYLMSDLLHKFNIEWHLGLLQFFRNHHSINSALVLKSFPLSDYITVMHVDWGRVWERELEMV